MLSRPTVPPFYNKVKLAVFPYAKANKLIAALEEEAVVGGSVSVVEERTARAGSGLGNHRGTDTITTV